MNRLLVTILLFAAILIFITSPFAALALLMLGLLVTAFFSTLWTVVQTIIGGSDTEKPSSP